jgi:hypothetical protein
MLQVNRHEKEGIQLVLDGAAMMRGTGPAERQYVEDMRTALLGKWGSWDCVADGGLGAQVYCALDELVRELAADQIGLATIRAADIRYTLTRWKNEGARASSIGTLADLSQPEELVYGLYRLDLRVPRGVETAVQRSSWLLIAPWDVRVYSDDKDLSIVGPEVRDWISIRDARQADKRINQAASATQHLQGLALMSSLKTAFPPPVRQVDFSVVARAFVELPEGRYRFAVTSDDGARLSVDGHRVIDAWSVHFAQRDTADLALTGGRHELRVEYFQAGGGYKLWVRVEPLEAAGR